MMDRTFAPVISQVFSVLCRTFFFIQNTTSCILNAVDWGNIPPATTSDKISFSLTASGTMMQMQNYILDLKEGEKKKKRGKIIKVFIWAHRENMVITSHPATQPTGYHYHWMHRALQFKILFESRNFLVEDFGKTVFLQKPSCLKLTVTLLRWLVQNVKSLQREAPRIHQQNVTLGC